MQIAVTFRHMETDEGVRDYVKEKVQRLQKYVDNPREAHVVLSVERFRHIAEITITGDGVLLNSQGKDSDLYAAIDQMVEKMERQAKERRQKRRKRPSAFSVKSFPQREAAVESQEGIAVSPMIKRRRTLAKPMSLEEAVAQLNRAQRDFLIFINSDSREVNVVCRAKDGGVEWVEPRAK